MDKMSISRWRLWLVWLVALVGCGACDTDTYSVRVVSQSGRSSGEYIVLTLFRNDGSIVQDSCYAECGDTVVFEGTVPDVCVAKIAVRDSIGALNKYHFFIEGGQIDIRLSDNVYCSAIPYVQFRVKGSMSHRIYAHETRDSYNEYGPVEDVCVEAADSCVNANAGAFFAPFLYYQTAYKDADFAEAEKQLESFSGEAVETYHYKLMKQELERKRASAIGGQAVNFTLADTAGGEVGLYKFLQGRRYVLIEFWASWCGPCRAEGGRLVKMYGWFAGEGFDVLAVSIDRKEADWKRAVAADGRPWTNVRDRRQPDGSLVSDIYDVRGVPCNFLVDSEGEIIARNLNAEELAERLHKLLE